MRGSIGIMVVMTGLVACGREMQLAQLAGYEQNAQNAGIVAKVEGGSALSLYASDSGGGLIPVIGEFGGFLATDQAGGKVILKDESGASVEVGIFENNEIELCAGAYLQVCDFSVARKFADIEGGAPVYSANISIKSNLTEDSDLSGTDRMEELNQFVLPSPDQQDAGSCLYMASTGAVEVLLNKDPKTRDLKSDGRSDLSERYLMNVSARADSKSWLTDAVLEFNQYGAVRNSDYRYTKGWLKESGGANVPASRGAEGAVYSTRYNWLDDLNGTVEAKAIDVPTIRRSIIYQDPDENQWNTGIMEPSDIEKIKTHLRTKKTPVLFVYNHYGYWHAVAIVGYNDSKVHSECSFAKSYVQQMRNSPRQLEYIQKVESKMSQYGCSTKGVFYVRDSIYRGDYRNVYDYDPTSSEDDAPYSKALVEHEYEWALYLGNHAYTVEF